ncbi:MAG: glycosyltransferase [Clostridia bacterium]|nr:glycosyltransferase [Clostridia bacterium]
MKILIQIPRLIYGGAEKVLVNFANFLVDKGHQVEILEIYEEGLLKDKFNKNVRFDAICTKEFTRENYVSLADIRSEKNPVKIIGKLIKKLRITVLGYRKYAEKLCAERYKGKEYDLAINYLETEPPGFLLRYVKAKKYLQWIHIDVRQIPKEDIGNHIDEYERMEKIVCVSETSKRSMEEIFPELKDKLEVIYNFYDTEDILKKAEDENPFDTDKLKILSIGRFVEQKAYNRALEIVEKLLKEGHDFCWYVIGGGGNIEETEKLIKEKGIEGNVKLLGLKDNPYPYIKNCDLFFLPSKYEGFPTVTIEAKVLEKPVLATMVCGIDEQIENGKQGIICENSEDGIYKALKEILDAPEKLKALTTNHGMAQVLENETKYQQFINII